MHPASTKSVNADRSPEIAFWILPSGQTQTSSFDPKREAGFYCVHSLYMNQYDLRPCIDLNAALGPLIIVPPGVEQAVGPAASSKHRWGRGGYWAWCGKKSMPDATTVPDACCGCSCGAADPADPGTAAPPRRMGCGLLHGALAALCSA